MTNHSPTWEGDVEALVGHGEVRDESELGTEIAKEARFDGGRQDGAGEPGHRIGEAAVLCNEQVIVRVLQVERVKNELHSWGEEVSDEIRSHRSHMEKPCSVLTGPRRRWPHNADENKTALPPQLYESPEPHVNRIDLPSLIIMTF